MRPEGHHEWLSPGCDGLVRIENKASTRNTRKRMWAMPAAEPAIPPKPRTAVTATTRKIKE